MTKFEQVRNLQ